MDLVCYAKSKGLEGIFNDRGKDNNAGCSGFFSPEEIFRDSLSLIGINPDMSNTLNKLSREQKVEYLRELLSFNQRESLDDEVFATSVYYTGEGVDWYTNSSLDSRYRFLDQLHPGERGGLVVENVGLTARLVYENPGKIVVSYSGPGPRAFDNDLNNPFKGNYDTGVISFTTKKGDGRVVSISVKVGEERDAGFVSQVIPDVYEKATSFSDKKRELSFFLTHPVVLSREELDRNVWMNNVVYVDKDGAEYRVWDVMNETISRLEGGLRDEISDYYDPWIYAFLDGPQSKEDGVRLFVGVARDWGVSNNLDVVFFRACSISSGISMSSLKNVLGSGNSSSDTFESVGGFSTNSTFGLEEGLGNSSITWVREGGVCVSCKGAGMIGPCSEMCERCEREKGN